MGSGWGKYKENDLRKREERKGLVILSNNQSVIKWPKQFYSIGIMKKIQLPNGQWEFDPSTQLGEDGGFGAVYIGGGENGDNVAIKELHITGKKAAHRELDIANDLLEKSFEHVMPVIDAGRDAISDRYYIVMPIADKSLQQELDEKGQFDETETIEILRSIVSGLEEVPHIVHRDLKPANILFHVGSWKIADFGIAKFVEESTSLQTLKECLSHAYSAPEQWKYETATSATDIYALGCIAHALILGHPPFLGPKKEDFHKQHVEKKPPTPENISPDLRSLVSNMLRKTVNPRPNLERVKSILMALEENDENSSGDIGKLAEAGANAAEEAEKREVFRSVEAIRHDEREQLRVSALEIFYDVLARLGARVTNDTPAAKLNTNDILWTIKLDDAELRILLLEDGRLIDDKWFPNSGWDVIVGATIEVHQKDPEYVWGANIWYTNLGNGDEYRWWEVTYMHHPRMKSRPSFQPYGLTNYDKADKAAASGMADYQFAGFPTPVDDENLESFLIKWGNLLTRASQGDL